MNAPSFFARLFGLASLFPLMLMGQDMALEGQIQQLEAQKQDSRNNQARIDRQLELLKLQKIRQDLENIGYPVAYGYEDERVVHTAMALGYAEAHEQARWVAHIITPDIMEGNHSRTNDFRPDSLVSTHTPLTEDYWDSGYDRGHLAPSADFRWSQVAISESYLYSNMSPQDPELNRKIWAELENKLREVVQRENEQLFVVTGGILEQDLPAIGIQNKVSIPRYYYKVALDPQGPEKKGIGFLVPNKATHYPLMQFAVSIDSVEALTGIDFFPHLSPEEALELEGRFDPDLWLSEKEQGDALPVDIEMLPRGYVSTIAVKYHVNSRIGVCGTVVSTKYHEPSGGTFLNLDRKFPNQVFSVTIWKDARNNFTYRPEQYLLNKEVCIQGDIRMNRGTPTMNITHEAAIELLEEVVKKG